MDARSIKERVRTLLGEQIEVLRPLGFVVEPGKVFRRVWVIVLSALVGDLGLLQTDDGTAKPKLRMVFEVEVLREFSRSMDAIDELFGSVEHAGGIGAFDDDRVAEALEHEGFFCARPELGDVFAEGDEEWIVFDCEEDAFVTAEFCNRCAQMLCGVMFARCCVRRKLDSRDGERRERSGKNDQREEECTHEWLVRNLESWSFASGLADNVGYFA